MKKLKIEKSLSGEFLVDKDLPGTIGKIGESYSYFGNRPVINSLGNHVGNIEKGLDGNKVFKKSFSCLPPISVK